MQPAEYEQRHCDTYISTDCGYNHSQMIQVTVTPVTQNKNMTVILGLAMIGLI